MHKERKTALTLANRLAKSKALSPTLRELVEVMRWNAWVRTYRRELMSYGFFVMQPMHKRIAEYMNIPFSDLAHIASWEIEAFLAHGKTISQKEIQKRSTHFAVGNIKGKPFIISGDDAMTLFNILQKKTQAAHTDEIRGQAVYHGQLRGTVRVIKKKEELVQFKKGEILVAHTVALWMTPIIDPCAGIITDAGGVLTHTAIVAREFQKPCIVGTKNTTELLHTGDRVEIDTKKGLVRVLS